MVAAPQDRALEGFLRALETSFDAALRYLNGRTPHRFTGVYRYDGDVLRNVRFVDAFDPDQTRGADVPMSDAYCAIVGSTREPLLIHDARNDPKIEYRPATGVVCYCGVLLADERGEPFGTLCHFDVKRCDAPVQDMPLLVAAAPYVFRAVRRELPPSSAAAPRA